MFEGNKELYKGKKNITAYDSSSDESCSFEKQQHARDRDRRCNRDRLRSANVPPECDENKDKRQSPDDKLNHNKNKRQEKCDNTNKMDCSAFSPLSSDEDFDVSFVKSRKDHNPRKDNPVGKILRDDVGNRGHRSPREEPKEKRHRSREKHSRDTSRNYSRTDDRKHERSDRAFRSHNRDRRLGDSEYQNLHDKYSGSGEYFNADQRSDGESDSYKNQPPNNTVMIRGLPQHITEIDIREDILKCDLLPRDIRLIRKKDTGLSRGFAFVEFNTLEEASRWIEMKRGVLILHGHYRAELNFSIPKGSNHDRSSLKSVQDWHCIKCGVHNFKRRDVCFKCLASRKESEKGGEGSGEVSSHPTHTVLLRSLDVLSTEDSVLQAIKSISNAPIRKIRIGQDSLTNTSTGICYIEMNNVMDAVELHDSLVAKSITVDGRRVLVSYCKLPSNSSNASKRSSVQNTWQPYDDQRQYTAEDIPRLAQYFATLYAHSPEEHVRYVQYYSRYYENQLSQYGSITLHSQTQADSVNAAAAVAQSAIKQVQAAKEGRKLMDVPKQAKLEENFTFHGSLCYNYSYNGEESTGTTVENQDVPDVSNYHYDETSGYYYDSQTGIYYDPNSKYYYNPQTSQFLYWDSESCSFLPFYNVSGEECGSKEDKKKNKGQDREEKIKTAKRIAKDMERWAKTLNQKKEIARLNVQIQPTYVPGKSVGSADAGFAILERKERFPCEFPVMCAELEEKQRQSSPPSTVTATRTNLVAAYVGGSDSEEDIEDVLQEEKKHTNWTKLACLLCKRQFPSKESLIRHQQLSDLHKQNLETWYRSRGLDPNDPQQRNKKYRDRAKERRLKFGESDAPQVDRLKEKYLKSKETAATSIYEEPTKAGIGAENVGSRLLHKMGWHEGMGLGKSNQGRTSIIETEVRMSTAGLGSRDVSFTAQPGESYKDCVKKMMYARYNEIKDK